MRVTTPLRPDHIWTCLRTISICVHRSLSRRRLGEGGFIRGSFCSPITSELEAGRIKSVVNRNPVGAGGIGT
jgi:hypothetical protein